jgi:hypothetical protein
MPAPTVNDTLLTREEGVDEPETVMVCSPAVAAGALKLETQLPLESARTPEATLEPSKVTVMFASLAAKPEPVRVTTVPGGPLVRFTVKLGSTVKLAVPTDVAEVETPEAAIRCVPPEEDGTVKLPLQLPWELAVMLEATVAPS